MIIQAVDINDVKPYSKNPRKNEKAVEYVKKSIDKFGFNQPIVVDGCMVIIAGHTRYYAAKELGYSSVPVFVADKLTKTQAQAYRIADNKVSEYSKWDNDLLIGEMLELKGDDFDLELTGFSQLEIDEILGEVQPEVDQLTPDDNELEIIVTCYSEEEQKNAYKLIVDNGFKAKVSGV